MTAEATDPADTADPQEVRPLNEGAPAETTPASSATDPAPPAEDPAAIDADVADSYAAGDAPLDSYSSGYDEDNDDDDEDDDDEDFYRAGAEHGTVAVVAPPPPAPLEFDIATVEPLSFAVLEEGRNHVFRSLHRRNRFRSIVSELSTAGEEGRRRGLAWWILAEYGRCAEELAAHEADDTAAFTRGKALMAVGRWNEAGAIFARLTSAYPNEPRPRSAWLEARLEEELAREGADEEHVSELIAGEIAGAPSEFAESAEGHYITARVAELRRDWETALDHYDLGREQEPNNRALLSRFARLAEQNGLDDVALEAYETLLCLGAMDRNMLLNLGVLYEDAGHDTEAAAIYDTVLQNNGTDQVARLYMHDARAAMEMYYDEDLEKKEDRLNQILRIPITDFELSVRARNCLNKMQICSLGDLVQRTEQELLSYKNFGETSLTEIKEILHSKGLRLGMPREEAVASIEAHAARTTSSEKGDVMNKPILELQLSIRARRTVETLGCLTVGDIIKHSAEELLGMPNFGQTSLMELRNKLGELGLKLKGE